MSARSVCDDYIWTLHDFILRSKRLFVLTSWGYLFWHDRPIHTIRRVGVTNREKDVTCERGAVIAIPANLNAIASEIKPSNLASGLMRGRPYTLTLHIRATVLDSGY